MAHIHSTTYGETRLRLLRVLRRGDRHDPKDVTVSLRLEGGDALPAEPLKNVVYRVARAQTFPEVEMFALAVADAILQQFPQVTLARVEASEHVWARLEAGGKAQGQAFVVGGPEQRATAITSNGAQIAVVSSIENLTLMRSAGFTPSKSPALADTPGDEGLAPLVVGTLAVTWTYNSPDVTFGAYRQSIRSAVLETMAIHASRSVQYTLYAVGDVLLASYPEISLVSLAMHERPYRPADLFHAHLENPNELFVTAEEPVGIVEVTLERDGERPN